VLGTTEQVLVFGSNDMNGSRGIRLVASANLPSANPGQYLWIQLLNKYDWRFVDSQGRKACGLDVSPEHDGAYNPTIGAIKEDSPWVLADQQKGETAASFEAAAYLMWRPSPAAQCAVENCTIPVPLAKLTWGWTGDAINTLTNQSNATTWILADCRDCSSGSPQTTSSHPVWETSTTAMGGLACLPMQ